jgi:hypothetical protein
MKSDLRVRTVGTRVCEEEYQALERLAQAQGQTLSEWTREVVLAQLNPTTAIPTEETVIAEVLALRTILLNVLFRIANGERLTEEEMRKLIERADAGKGQKARERLTAKVAGQDGAR